MNPVQLKQKVKVAFYHPVRKEPLTGWLFAKERINNELKYLISYEVAGQKFVHYANKESIINLERTP